MLPYRVILTKNKHSYAKLINGEILLSIPEHLKESQKRRIKKMLLEKVRVSQKNIQGKKIVVSNLIDQNKIQILGRKYILNTTFSESLRHSAKLNSNSITLSRSNKSKSDPETYFKNWIKKTFHSDLTELITSINSATLKSSKISSIVIFNAKSRLGSCSRDGRIMISIRSLMLDRPLLEYVIIHELCHLKEMNHGEKFWKLVGSFLPDYKKRRKKIKDIIFI